MKLSTPHISSIFEFIASQRRSFPLFFNLISNNLNALEMILFQRSWTLNIILTLNKLFWLRLQNIRVFWHKKKYICQYLPCQFFANFNKDQIFSIFYTSAPLGPTLTKLVPTSYFPIRPKLEQINFSENTIGNNARKTV